MTSDTKRPFLVVYDYDIDQPPRGLVEVVLDDRKQNKWAVTGPPAETNFIAAPKCLEWIHDADEYGTLLDDKHKNDVGFLFCGRTHID